MDDDIPGLDVCPFDHKFGVRDVQQRSHGTKRRQFFFGPHLDRVHNRGSIGFVGNVGVVRIERAGDRANGGVQVVILLGAAVLNRRDRRLVNVESHVPPRSIGRGNRDHKRTDRVVDFGIANRSGSRASWPLRMP